MSNSDLISTKVLKELARAGSIRSVVLVAVPGGFALRVRYGLIERTLERFAGGPRVFRSLDAAARFVKKDINLAHADLDLSNWDPGGKQ